MSQSLLSPPKFKPRHFAIIVALELAFPLTGGVWQAVRGMKPAGTLAWQAALLIALGVASVLVYGRVFRRAATIRPERMPLVHVALAIGPMALFVFSMNLMLRGTILASSLQGMYFMVPCMAGMMLVQGGWTRRSGESKHCPKCDYEFTFEEASAPIRCPECATPWLGRLIKGRKIKSRKMMGVGAATVVLGFLVSTPILWITPFAPHLPTPVLYAALYMDPRAFSASEELAKRPLAEGWVKAMARRVISTSNANQWASGGSAWFRALVTSGKMPADMIELANREAFRATLEAPARVKAGEPFSIHLRVTRAADGASGQLGVMFAGYRVDDGPAQGRAADVTFAHDLRPDVFSGPRQPFEQRLTLPAGKHRITATYWVIMQPSFWPVAWGNDGVPVRPAAATWFERVDAVVDVEAK